MALIHEMICSRGMLLALTKKMEQIYLFYTMNIIIYQHKLLGENIYDTYM